MPTIRLDDPDPAVLDGRHIRASAFEAAQRELIGTLSPRRHGAGSERPRALTLGAGYSSLPQLLADRGYQVTATDPSPDATDEARRRAMAGHRLDSETVVDHQTAQPGGDADTYDLTWCVDTIEIVSDPRGVLAEIARVTRPGGTIVLDTLNDTMVSRAIYLGLFQRFPLTRFMPPDRYHRRALLTPAELTAVCHEVGIKVESIIGYEPASPIALLGALLARRRGAIQDHELSDRARFRLSAPGHTPPVTYFAIGTPR